MNKHKKDFYKRISNNIKKYRETIGATQQMLADVCGYKSSVNISLIESGKRKVSLYDLYLISKAHDRKIQDYISEGNNISCDICADTTFMLCNGKNMRCVFCKE